MIQLGIETLLRDKMSLLKGKRVGLLTNITGLDSRLCPTIDLLMAQPDIHLSALFGPEHGVRGDGQEGLPIESYTDPLTHLPVYSLYGNTRKPCKAMLKNIDCIVIDLQDIGVRYYTFISTMSLVMEACMEESKEVVVLDRPNPLNGLNREGNILDKSLSSFVGMHPLPNRHGLTIGELSLLYKHEFGLNCSLTVVPMKRWSRTMYFRETGLCWVQPSPNATGEAMAVLYPGMCLIEGTTLSEGRGTTRPFEVIGAPYMNGSDIADKFNQLGLKGVLARSTSFVPYYSKYKGKLCRGIQIHITDISKVQSYKIGLYTLGLIAEMYPSEFSFLGNGNRCTFNLLAGNTKIRQKILENNFDDFFEQCQAECDQFSERVMPYLLY